MIQGPALGLESPEPIFLASCAISAVNDRGIQPPGILRPSPFPALLPIHDPIQGRRWPGPPGEAARITTIRCGSTSGLGEVLLQSGWPVGLSHQMPLHPFSGQDPEGVVPAVLGHEVGAVVEPWAKG